MNAPCSWPFPAAHPELRAAEVHLWFADLAQPAEVVQALGEMLSSDERARAARLRFERDRRRYVVGRGLLRQLLGRYSGLNGQDLVFRYGEWGKPTLADYQNAGDLRFNLSHSGDGAVFAFTTRRRIGVDMELIRPVPEAVDIMHRFFPPEDRRSEHLFGASQRAEAVFWFWTRREAFLKALGTGLAGADLVTGAMTNDSLPGRSPDRQSGRAASAWFLHTFRPAHNLIGTVAVEGNQCDLKYYQGGLRQTETTALKCVSRLEGHPP